MAEPLKTYREKRRFAETPEPAGSRAAGPAGEGGRFVVHEHHARRLHWDLRLERDGVLASWAIPNGIPDDPEENRKAVHTEDHPLEYIDFQGEIPAGSYGAGKMSIWDSGTYFAEKWEPKKVVVRFEGERLRGRYALFEAGSEKDWLMHRMDPPEDPGRDPFPEDLEPMRARPGRLPRSPERFGFEILWRGRRALAFGRPGRLAIRDEAGEELAPLFPELGRLKRAFGARDVVLDGCVCVFDADGRPDSETLAERLAAPGDSQARRMSKSHPAVFVAFDLLYGGGRLLVDRPYSERREALTEAGFAEEVLQVPAHHAGDGAPLRDAAEGMGLPGIVAKQLDSKYRSGRVGDDWREIRL